MGASPFLSVVVWAAYLSAAMTIVTLIAGTLSFTRMRPFGVLSDIASVLLMLLMVPLAIATPRLLPATMQVPGVVAAVIGIAAMVVVAVGQSLLIARQIEMEKAVKFLHAAIAVGIWLLVTNVLLLIAGSAPVGLWLAGLVAGIGYIVTMGGVLENGKMNLLYSLGGLMMCAGYAVWAIWLGRLLTTGALSLGL